MLRANVGPDACGPGYCAGMRPTFTYDQVSRAVSEGLIVLEDCPHNAGIAHGRVTALGRLAVTCYELVHRGTAA
jgi:hypothetical protein